MDDSPSFCSSFVVPSSHLHHFITSRCGSYVYTCRRQDHILAWRDQVSCLRFGSWTFVLLFHSCERFVQDQLRLLCCIIKRFNNEINICIIAIKVYGVLINSASKLLSLSNSISELLSSSKSISAIATKTYTGKQRARHARIFWKILKMEPTPPPNSSVASAPSHIGLSCRRSDIQLIVECLPIQSYCCVTTRWSG